MTARLGRRRRHKRHKLRSAMRRRLERRERWLHTTPAGRAYLNSMFALAVSDAYNSPCAWGHE